MDRTSNRPNSRPPNADKMHICIRPEELPTVTPSPNRKTAPRTTDRTRRTNRRPSPDQRQRRTDCNLQTVTKEEDAGTIPGNAAQLQNLNEDPRKQHSRRRKQNSRQPTDISTRTAPHSHITPYLVHRAIFQHCMAIYTTANKRRLKSQIQSHVILTAYARKTYGPLKSHLQPFKPSPMQKYMDRQKTPLNAIQTAKQPHNAAILPNTGQFETVHNTPRKSHTTPKICTMQPER